MIIVFALSANLFGIIARDKYAHSWVQEQNDDTRYLVKAPFNGFL